MGIAVNRHIIYIIHIKIFTIINSFLYSGLIIAIKNAINNAKIEIIKYIYLPPLYFNN